MKRTCVTGTALLALMVTASVAIQAQGRGRGADKGRGNAQQPPQAAVSAAEQQQRIQQQQQREAQYKQHLTQQVQVVQRQTAQLQQQKRNAQYQAQQEYQARLLQQQQQLQTQRNYARDPYVTTPHNYRYVVAGTARQTNQYGVDVLRQAVNLGYQEGVRAGAADRQDRWKSSYQSSPEYQDANYGYTGQYVDQSDYNYYFRQGFQRGYSDGYNSRSQYGSITNGNGSILGNLLTSILGLISIH